MEMRHVIDMTQVDADPEGDGEDEASVQSEGECSVLRRDTMVQQEMQLVQEQEEKGEPEVRFDVSLWRFGRDGSIVFHKSRPLICFSFALYPYTLNPLPFHPLSPMIATSPTWRSTTRTCNSRDVPTDGRCRY